MTFNFLALPLILSASLALAACGQQGKAGPPGPQGPEGPIGPRGPQGLPGKDAATPAGKAGGAREEVHAAGAPASVLLRRPVAETDKKESTAACTEGEEIVSAICVARRGRSPTAQVDVEKKSARCPRSTLYMVCGKSTAFVNE